MTEVEELRVIRGFLVDAYGEFKEQKAKQAFDNIRQALEQRRVPEGYQLVPTELPLFVREAVVNAALARGRTNLELDWKAALEALATPDNGGDDG